MSRISDGAAGQRYIGRSMIRKEDPKLLTGLSQYIGDLAFPGLLEVAFLRSDLAHAKISVDVSGALEQPGVVDAVCGRDLIGKVKNLPGTQMSLSEAWKQAVDGFSFDSPENPAMPYDMVHYSGQIVAAVAAESRYAAEDALDAIKVDYEPLPVVVDPEEALNPGAPLVHSQMTSNVHSEVKVSKGDFETAYANAPHKLSERIHHHRYTGTPMEGRGVIAIYDHSNDTLTVWSSTQVVHLVRRNIAALLGMPEARVRVLAPDVGGGFGQKCLAFPEEIVVAYLARKLGRPIRWVEDRREHFYSTTHARDKIHHVDVAFDDDGRILALRDNLILDGGAWFPFGLLLPSNCAAHLLGPYKVDNYSFHARVAATNKVPNQAYRGAGRPGVVFAMERIMDLIADHLGLDPYEVRMRNMVPAEEMPYTVGVPYRDGVPVTYDSGDFPQALKKAVDALGGIENIRKMQADARKEGRHIGLGIGCYVEGTGVGPFEGATVRMDPSGVIHAMTGAATQGQGHKTVYAQIVADLWGVTPEQVVISEGDTSLIAFGVGTIASRSTVVSGEAIRLASERLIKRVRELAAFALECSPEDIELQDGKAIVRGAPARSITFQELVQRGMPGFDRNLKRPEGFDPVLEETYYYEPPTVTWSYATHAALVEVDTDTGKVDILKYAIAHDCGTVINPLLADAQIHGGLAQGLGGAMLEELIYDDNGQLLTASFMDYTIPTVNDIPELEMVHMEIPSPLNGLGVKGVGEGGAIAPPATIANAVSDALRPFGVRWNTSPVRPDRIVSALQSAVTG